jgi:hypothetical protein
MLFQRCPAPARASRKTSGKRAPEKRAPPTMQAGASEEPVPRNASVRVRRRARHRDRFPATAPGPGPAAAADPAPDPAPAPAAGSPQRAWRMPGAAEEVPHRVVPGRCRRAPGTAPVGPDAHATLGLREAREGAHRRRATRGIRGTGAGQPPVALRAKAGRCSFSGARLPHALRGKPAGSARRKSVRRRRGRPVPRRNGTEGNGPARAPIRSGCVSYSR